MLSIAAEAYEQATGSELPASEPPRDQAGGGDLWDFDDEEEMRRRLPRLSACSWSRRNAGRMGGPGRRAAADAGAFRAWEIRAARGVLRAAESSSRVSRASGRHATGPERDRRWVQALGGRARGRSDRAGRNGVVGTRFSKPT